MGCEQRVRNKRLMGRARDELEVMSSRLTERARGHEVNKCLLNELAVKGVEQELAG